MREHRTTVQKPRVSGSIPRPATEEIPWERPWLEPHRINLWDTMTGAIAHQLALPSGLPLSIDVSPNGRYLAAMIEDEKDGLKLSVWRLDDEMGSQVPAVAAPAATPPQ